MLVLRREQRAQVSLLPPPSARHPPLPSRLTSRGASTGRPPPPSGRLWPSSLTPRTTHGRCGPQTCQQGPVTMCRELLCGAGADRRIGASRHDLHQAAGSWRGLRRARRRSARMLQPPGSREANRSQAVTPASHHADVHRPLPAVSNPAGGWRGPRHHSAMVGLHSSYETRGMPSVPA